MSLRNQRIFTLLFCTFSLLSFWSCKNQKADLLLINGVVHTVNDQMVIKQAIAIEDGKIVEVGLSVDLLYDYDAEKIIDLEGRPVFPGFIDAHCHFYNYALVLQQVNLEGTQSWREVVQRVALWGNDHEEGWIIGRGWDQNDWTKTEFPTNKSLDSLYPDRPVYLTRIDGHAAIANSAALEAAGITGKTRVKGGKIPTRGGRPTGLLIDNAMDQVRAVIPEPSPEKMREYLMEAQENCLAVGLTTLDEAGLDKSQIDLLDALQKSGDLKLRIYAMAAPTEENLDHYLSTGPYKTERMHVTSFKIYADGALGSRGACLLQPYKDDLSTYGMMLEELDYYREMATRLYDAGFQMNTHCIGDSANRFILKVYAEALPPDNDRRWRIEHAQILHPDDFQRFATHRIIPSVQPTHATSDMQWAKNRIGKNRLPGAYAYKTLLDQNHMIPFGSDFPVENINPLYGFYAAVARTDTAGRPYGGFQMQDAVGRDTALRAMTIWAARSNFEEGEKGSIEVGKVADLVVLEEDLLFMDLEKVPFNQVYFTMINGEVVYDTRKSNPAELTED